MIVCVTDIETTGPDESDQIIEIGSYLMEEGGLPKAPFQCLVAPTIPIPPTASAVHHIMDEDLIQAAPWAHVSAAWLGKTHEAEVFVAHNARFETTFLGELTAPRPWVCTYKCAMRAWPDAPGFGNQVLRYWRNPKGLDRRHASESHRALPDAYVTAFLFRDLLLDHDLETLIRWSAEIPMPPVFSFGKHKGMKWTEVPDDYLTWIVNKSEMDADTKAYATHVLDLRRLPEERAPDVDPRAATYVNCAEPMIVAVPTVADLGAWWKDERFRREEYGIIAGTPEYEKLVALCASRKTALMALSESLV